MEQVVPWKPLLNRIEPFYPVAGRGRHPYPLETMLRVHLMQNWFGLSDPAMEGALYEITVHVPGSSPRESRPQSRLLRLGLSVRRPRSPYNTLH